MSEVRPQASSFVIRHSFGFRVSLFGFRRGFSALELLVVLSILSLLLAIFIPYLLKVREDNNRMRCFDNLRTLGGALNDYAKTNGGDYPRTVYNPALIPGGYTCYTGADSPNPFAKNTSVRANDVTASLWLLVRMKLAQPSDFICPSTSDAADTFVDAAGEPTLLAYRSNFRDPENLSYSYACPFSAAAEYRFNSDRLGSSFAVIADKNPGVEDGGNVTGPAATAPPLALAAANSANHGRAGQNVLYADGHAEFRATPYCGVDGDNIYTAQAETPLAGPAAAARPAAASVVGVIGQTVGPACPSDSYLVPTESDLSSESGPAPSPPPHHPPQPPPAVPVARPTPPAHPALPKPAPTPPPKPKPIPPPHLTTQPHPPAAPASRPAAPVPAPLRRPVPAATQPVAAPATAPHPATAPLHPIKPPPTTAPTSRPARR